jgi:hypothetical protein
MQIQNTHTIITKRGNTSDIIDVVMLAYDVEDDYQIKKLADKLQESSELRTCRNIWKFLVEKINYVADRSEQKIKTPARLIHDKEGDCKSYSVLTACILRYLGINHFFRFVSYDNNKTATHVYIVACIDGKEIPIDAVAYVQARADFGTEIKYTYRVDMSDRTTQIAYLAGLGDRHMIGNTDNAPALLPHQILPLWNDNENMDSQKKAYTYLVSEWDKNWVLYAVAQSVKEQIEILNELQYIAVMIYLFKKYHTDNEMLERLGVAMAYLIGLGVFDSDEPNPENRDFFSTENIETVKQCIGQSDVLPWNDVFMSNWEENVVEENTYPRDHNGETMSIGSVNNATQAFYDIGPAFLYQYISDADVRRMPSAVSRKRNTQAAMRGWYNAEASSAVSPATQNNRILSGCTVAWGGTPERVIADIQAGKISINGTAQIGEPVTAVLAIVAAVIGIVNSLIKMFKKEKPTPSQNDIDNMYPNPGGDGLLGAGTSGGSGITTMPGGNVNTAGITWLLPLALLGGLFFSKSKKGKKKKTKR